MDEGPTWTIREAGESDAPALALIGAATFLETFAGIIDGAAILGHCAAQHSAAAYRDHLAAGARAWLAEALPGGAPIGFALITKPDLAAAAEGDIELKRSEEHTSELQSLMRISYAVFRLKTQNNI